MPPEPDAELVAAVPAFSGVSEVVAVVPALLTGVSEEGGAVVAALLSGVSEEAGAAVEPALLSGVSEDAVAAAGPATGVSEALDFQGHTKCGSHIRVYKHTFVFDTRPYTGFDKYHIRVLMNTTFGF